MSRDRHRIALLLASLNHLEIFACYIGNSYLNAKSRDKICTKSSTEFGSEKGREIIIVRALNGLNSSGISWRKKIVDNLKLLGYK